MEYKNTLNLPKTDFAMKADLPRREPEFLKMWLGMDIYGLLRSASKGKKRYILHDGPPYANGDIHIGHALNKTLKDIVVKYMTMQGYDSSYVPGWDCHGLPIEHALFKELKMHKSQISQVDFRKKAHGYAMKFVERQREQFKRLGVFGDWDNPYLTLSREYEEAIVSSFYALNQEGYVYRGHKPVNWCFRCETALAEAEVEYEEHVSPSIFVKFALDDGTQFGSGSFLLVWTTTPWTLIANVAVAVHPEFRYCLVKTEKGNLIVAADLLPSVMEQAGLQRYEVLKEVTGSLLEGLVYSHPFGLRKGRVVLADYVARDEGTGLVHTAPGHGNEDYLTGTRYRLECVMPVDNRGNFDKTAGEFSGMNVLEANKPIIDKLASTGALLFNSKVQHSYPHCWRCKNPIIFRATKQWFLAIDHNDLRRKLTEAIEKEVTWIPAAGRERIRAMVELRPDWCLSRQRYWGVPIPALVCEDCKEEFFSQQVIKNFAALVSSEGSDCWFERDLKDFLPEGGVACPQCKGRRLVKGTDILDVWFDSGVSHQAVLKKRQELGGTPCDLYLEGSDQHRGWFQSSLIPSMAIDGRPPFRAVLTHGFVVDGEGRKMSKSLGNVISPQDIIKEYGADILRLWVASSDYNEDVRISKEMLSRLSEAYRKIRNTIRFILSNLYDFEPDRNKVDYGSLKKIDRWVLWRMEHIRDCAENAYGTAENPSFEFYKAYKSIYEFCNEDLSMYYLDMVKGRLYTSRPDSVERRAAQTAMYEVLDVLVRLMAPILAFTAEDVWQHMPKKKKDAAARSVHLLDWPQPNPLFRQDDEAVKVEDELKPIFDLLPDTSKLLEELRSNGQIGSSFDARIKLLTNSEIRYKYLESLRPELCEIFKVSLVEVEKRPSLDTPAARGTQFPDIALEASKAEGGKCERCWNYSPSVGTCPGHEGLCQRCAEVIGGK